VFVHRTRLRVEIIADHAVQRELLSGHLAGRNHVRTRYCRAWLLDSRTITPYLVTICIHDKAMAPGDDTVVYCRSNLAATRRCKRVIGGDRRLKSRNADQILGSFELLQLCAEESWDMHHIIQDSIRRRKSS
jgi:hypothetical protein